MFTFSNRKHNFSSTPEKIEKGRCQKNTEGGGWDLLSL